MIKILVSKKDFPEGVRFDELYLYAKYYDTKRNDEFQIVRKDICIVIEEEDIEALENQKTGHWNYTQLSEDVNMFICNQCHFGFRKTYNFCPNCGAKMEGE